MAKAGWIGLGGAAVLALGMAVPVAAQYLDPRVAGQSWDHQQRMQQQRANDLQHQRFMEQLRR